MIKIIILTILSSITVFLLMFSGRLNFNEDYYISQQVIDTSSPLNVSIDVEFLQKLTPAYEQQ